MADYGVEVAGWTEWDQPDDVLWYEVPEDHSLRDVNNLDPHDIEGLWVHVYNLDDPQDEHWFWVRSYMSLDFDQWDDLVAGAMDMHGMTLA